MNFFRTLFEKYFDNRRNDMTKNINFKYLFRKY